MANETPSVGDLRKAAVIANDEIDAAAYAYLATPKGDPFRFSSGHEIDLAAAVDAYPPAVAAVADSDRTPMFKWTMVRTAILLAQPVKG
ncbi:MULTISPECIES: hypothetical protein [unclassified Methylobacterium]|uniref:hypothetical protein n=1 Tax=unclassified Methylobacterium TaxID=2615210 RepID=UPI002269CB0E|nr:MULTISPECIES: hypothetical protein [unclassified Methylobacterium]